MYAVSCEDIFTLVSVRIRLVTQLVELNLHMILLKWELFSFTSTYVIELFLCFI